MKLKDGLSLIALVPAILAFVQDPLPPQLRLHPQLQVVGGWFAGFGSVLAFVIALAWKRQLTRATLLKTGSLAIFVGFGFMVTYWLFAASDPPPSGLVNFALVAFWSLMFVCVILGLTFLLPVSSDREGPKGT